MSSDLATLLRMFLSTRLNSFMTSKIAAGVPSPACSPAPIATATMCLMLGSLGHISPNWTHLDANCSIFAAIGVGVDERTSMSLLVR